jgi:RNA polymerase sigma-70 factor (ECF subfamily)
VGEVDLGLATFCRQEQARLVGALALYVGDQAVAEELAQEALIRLCQHWPRVSGSPAPRAWLHGVAMNLARSWWRRWYAERRALARHGGVVDRADRDTADATDAVAVRRAVAGLPPRQRQALVLRHYADLTVRDVASQMGCAEGTVKALTSQAIDSLRQQFRDSRQEETSDDRGSRALGPNDSQRAPSP